MLFGLLSVIKSIEGDFKNSAFLIIIAAVIDFSDGFVARKLNIVSKFGKYLDSNSDSYLIWSCSGIADIFISTSSI